MSMFPAGLTFSMTGKQGVDLLVKESDQSRKSIYQENL